MGSHTARSGGRNAPPPPPEFLFENLISDSRSGTDTAHYVIEQIVLDGAKILYMRYIQSQKIPYASRTLARELVLNASWASIPLDIPELIAEPDSDLTLPQIDEWSGGVLPVRNAEHTPLRTSVTPQRETRRPLFHRTRPPVEDEPDKKPPAPRPPSIVPSQSKTVVKPVKRAPTITEAQLITKAFEEARKKTNVSMKSVTVDSDFTVIQINEPKGLPPALIVPSVSTKGRAAAKSAAAAVVPVARLARPVLAKSDGKKKRPHTALVPADVPIFDEEVAGISYADKFVCAPGVTFKDGSTVKSRPPVANSAQMTKAQYATYLEEMKRSGEEPAKT
jgi:hypothetical protein